MKYSPSLAPQPSQKTSLKEEPALSPVEMVVRSSLMVIFDRAIVVQPIQGQQ